MFLDADILVVRSCDVLFRCPGFCAVLRHSERFNSGVMSLAPSAALFEQMMQQVDRLPSYTGCALPRSCLTAQRLWRTRLIAQRFRFALVCPLHHRLVQLHRVRTGVPLSALVRQFTVTFRLHCRAVTSSIHTYISTVSQLRGL